LSVSNDAAFGGNVLVAGNVYINGIQVTTGPSSQWGTSTTGNIYYRGNVGIGGGDPQYTLDVSGTTNIRGNTTILSSLLVSGNIYINGVQVSTSGGGGSGGGQWSNSSTAGNIYYAGNVGIGKGDPQYALDISGTTYITGTAYATYFISTSDYRIKQNPKPLDSSYNVDHLNPIHYTNLLSQKEDLGFIAHEVQEVFPYLVEGEKDGTGNQSLNYIGLIAVLVKEIQELKKRVSILESK
jgi:hypothetical protein